MRDVEFFVVDVVKEHVDPAQVVGGQVNFLPVEPLPHVVFPEDLRELQE